MTEETLSLNGESGFKCLDESFDRGNYLNIVGGRELTDVVVAHLTEHANQNQVEVVHIAIPDGGVDTTEEMFELIASSADLGFARDEGFGAMINLSSCMNKLPKDKKYLFIFDHTDNLTPNRHFNTDFFLTVRALNNGRVNGKAVNVTCAVVGEKHPNDLLPIENFGQFNKGENFLVHAN